MVLLLITILGCGGQGEKRLDLVEVPMPNLANFEESVHQQLEGQAQAVKALESERSTSVPELAVAYGELGRRYHVYELYDAALACYRNAHLLAPEEFRWVYYLAVVLQTTGQLEEAAQYFEAALVLKPRDLPSHVRLGQTYLAAERLAEARRQLDQALEIDGECALAHYFLGQLASSAGEFSTAVEHFEQVARLEPTATILYYALAQAYQGLGEGGLAARQIEKMGSEEVRLADPLLNELENLRTGAAVYLRRGARAQVDGAWEAALEEYRKAVEADPENPEARQGVAAVLVHQGDYEGALKQYQKAIELGAKNAAVYFNLAGALALTGRLEESIAQYDQVFALEPQHREALFALARVLVKADRRGEAITRFQNLLMQGTKDVRIHLELAALLRQDGKIEESQSLAGKVLELDASSADRARAHLILASLAVDAGRVDEALVHFQQATREAPEMAAAHFALANQLGARGRYREAAAAYHRTLEIDPEHSAARLGEATALVLAGDSAAARRRLEEGLGIEPENEVLAQALARLLATSRDATVRDGVRALDLARALFESSQSVETAELMALALAENGRFADAAKWQRRVVKGLRQGAAAESIARAEVYLQSLEQGRPIRN